LGPTDLLLWSFMDINKIKILCTFMFSSFLLAAAKTLSSFNQTMVDSGENTITCDNLSLTKHSTNSFHLWYFEQLIWQSILQISSTYGIFQLLVWQFTFSSSRSTAGRGGGRPFKTECSIAKLSTSTILPSPLQIIQIIITYIIL